MKCAKCGNEIHEKTNFCTKCGAKLEIQEEPKPQKFCVKCGAKLEPTQKFCVKCGEPVTRINEQPQKPQEPVENKTPKEAAKEAPKEVKNEPVLIETHTISTTKPVTNDKKKEDAVDYFNSTKTTSKLNRMEWLTLIIGILSIVISLFINIISGIVSAAIGLFIGILNKNKNKAGIICCIVSIVISVFELVAGTILIELIESANNPIAGTYTCAREIEMENITTTIEIDKLRTLKYTFETEGKEGHATAEYEYKKIDNNNVEGMVSYEVITDGSKGKYIYNNETIKNGFTTDFTITMKEEGPQDKALIMFVDSGNIYYCNRK